MRMSSHQITVRHTELEKGSFSMCTVHSDIVKVKYYSVNSYSPKFRSSHLPVSDVGGSGTSL